MKLPRFSAIIDSPMRAKRVSCGLLACLTLGLGNLPAQEEPAIDVTVNQLPDGRFRIWWPEEVSGYVLQRSLGLREWGSVDVEVITDGGHYVDLAPAPREFFRLVKEAGPPPIVTSKGLITANREGTATGNKGVSEADFRVSGNGRYVVFTSGSSDLTGALDENDVADVFYRDLETGETVLLTLDKQSNAAAENWEEGVAASVKGISRDGRYVLFSSSAAGLGSESFGGLWSYIWDRETGELTLPRVEVDGWEVEAGAHSSMSEDGKAVVFNGAGGYLFVYELESGETSIIHENPNGDRSASRPLISADGNKVLFPSRSPNITDHADTNVADDLFIHDRTTGKTDLVTMNAAGDAASSVGTLGGYAMSPDGRYVAFFSLGSDLVPAGVDENNGLDLFLRDTVEGTTTLVTAKADGTAADPSDPSSFVFSAAPSPSFGGEGNLLVFQSAAGNLDTGVADTNQTFDAFLYRIDTGELSVVSTNQEGTATANDLAFRPMVSRDGKKVVYSTRATNLGFENDTNGRFDDLVVKDLATGVIQLLSTGPDGQSTAPTGINTLHYAIDDTGSVAVFTSRDAALSDLPDENFRYDLFFARP